MYTIPIWSKYGLAIADSVMAEGKFDEVSRSHNLVVDYLESHPDVVKQYKSDQSGTIKYYDVLKLAGG